jgi:hypothetical protein
MATVIHQSALAAGFTFNQGLTRYFPIHSGRCGQATTESQIERTVRAAGTCSNLWVRVTANSLSGAATFRHRTNRASGNQVVTVGSGLTGDFLDSSNSDAVIATDEIDCQLVTDAGTGSVTFTIISENFAASSNTYGLQGANINLSSPAATTTYYEALAGAGVTLQTTEANAQCKMQSGGTLKNLFLNITTNTSDLASVKSRINGADGTLLITVLGTGIAEDTTHSDPYVAGDLVNYAFTTGGAGGGNFFATGGAATETTDSVFPVFTGTISTSGVTVNASQTVYFLVGGEMGTGGTATEANVRGQINYAATASKLEVYISANTVSATSTLKLRKNGADGNQSVSITASTTGWFEDASNTDSIASGDEIDYQLATGGSGTSLTLFNIGMLLTTGASAAPRLSRLTLTGVS